MTSSPSGCLRRLPVLAGIAAWCALSLTRATAAADGEPDAGIAPGPGPGGASVTILLRDRDGVGVAGAAVTIESLGTDGERRYMEVRTDGAGRARVLGVPAGKIERLEAGYTDGEGLTVISDPVPVPEGRETVIELAIPEPTESPGALAIDVLHMVLERKGAAVLVTSSVTMRSAPGTSYRGAPLRLPLPAGAVAPMVPVREGRAPAATLEGDAFLVRGPIPAAGLEIEVRFEIPIEGGEARFVQDLGMPVDSLRVISTWTVDPAELRVAGAPPAGVVELGGGIDGLVVMGSGLRDGRLEVALAGLTRGPEVSWRRGALLVSLALLLLGAGCRWRRGRAGGVRN